MKVTAYIAMGSNLGDRRAFLDAGVEGIRLLPETTIDAISSPIETEPVGPDGQERYLNAVVAVETGLDPESLLSALLKIEAGCGRDRSVEQRWGPRTLDLDLLLFGDQQIDIPGLCVPHPRMHERSFVLIPLCQLAPELRIPGRKETPRAMLAAINGS